MTDWQWLLLSWGLHWRHTRLSISSAHWHVPGPSHNQKTISVLALAQKPVKVSFSGFGPLQSFNKKIGLSCPPEMTRRSPNNDIWRVNVCNCGRQGRRLTRLWRLSDYTLVGELPSPLAILADDGDSIMMYGGGGGCSLASRCAPSVFSSSSSSAIWNFTGWLRPASDDAFCTSASVLAVVFLQTK